MRDRCDLALALARQIGIPHIALAAVRRKAHAPGDIERRIQRLLRAGAERSARLCRALYAVHRHQRAQIRKERFLAALNKCVHFL